MTSLRPLCWSWDDWDKGSQEEAEPERRPTRKKHATPCHATPGHQSWWPDLTFSNCDLLPPNQNCICK